MTIINHGKSIKLTRKIDEIKKSKEIHKTRKTIESWLNDSWESAFLLQAHHALICVHRRTRSPHPEARKETCRDQAGRHRHCEGGDGGGR